MLWILVILVVAVVGILWLRRSPDRSTETADDSPDTAPAEAIVRGPIDDSLDLHGLPPQEFGPVVDAYVEEARRLGFPQVKIIHGRGIGMARRTVHVHLARSPHVDRFHDAPPPSGRGATIAILHPPDPDIATSSHPH
jgi:dsDNA-specific endonuclease/ATPase MutS2